MTVEVGYTPVAPELEVEAQNTDGSAGSTLCTMSGVTDYTYSKGTLTFTTPTSFTLSAGTGYWLVLSDSSSAVFWNYASSSSYTSASGFSLPTSDTYFSGATDNPSISQDIYGSLAAGPQIFQLNTNAVSSAPEPSTFLYSLPLAVGALLIRRKRATQAGEAHRTTTSSLNRYRMFWTPCEHSS